MTKMLELQGTYVRERFRFENEDNDTIIGEIISDGKRITVKGPMDEDDPKQNLTYRFYGHWTEYHNKRNGRTENQFAFKTLIISEPHTQNGIVRYLIGAPKIGKAIANHLWNRFGGMAVQMLREEPELAAESIKGLSVDGATEASVWLEKNWKLENLSIQLIDLLGGKGFPAKTPKRAIQKWGNKATQFLQDNPYNLLSMPGCGFKRSDQLYLDLGGDPARIKRQALCAWHAVSTDTSGDTWSYVGLAEQAIRDAIGGAECNVPKAMRLATRAGLLETVWTDGQQGPRTLDGNVQWVADARRARNERTVARCITDGGDGLPWPVSASDVGNISEHQREKLRDALKEHWIAILGGSPGTGKTYTAAATIKQIIARHGAGKVAVCAPTGKAAVRVTEALTEYGLKLRARTIHSLLKVLDHDGGKWHFEYGPGNPLPFKFLIVDESSMIDTDLMASFLEAIGYGTKVLFVGDVNQLPPVGHGAPLRDMINAGLPYGELTEIRRNAGAIVEACAAMRDGKEFECKGNLHFSYKTTPEMQLQSVLFVLDNHQKIGRNPVWECQIVVAVNQRSGLARKEVNALLQQHLNPEPGDHTAKHPFRLNDKVVCLRNSFYTCIKADQEATTNISGQVYVANGELGCITHLDKKFFVADLSAPKRRVRVPLWTDTDNGMNWDLAYALTVHKMQGSEAPVVIVLVDEYPGAKMICDRAWMYTAISRAKKECYLVGQLETAHKFCKVNNIQKRKTFLEEMI